MPDGRHGSVAHESGGIYGRHGTVAYTSLAQRGVGNISVDRAIPGTVYEVPLQGTWDASGKTATLGGVALTLSAQDADSVTFTVPTPFADSSAFDLLNLDTVYGLIITDGTGPVAGAFRIDAPAQPTYHYISSVTGGPTWNESSVLDVQTDVATGDSLIVEVTAGSAFSSFGTDGSWVAIGPLDFRVKAFNADGWQAAWSEFELRYEGNPAFIGPAIGNRSVAENASFSISTANRFTDVLTYSLTGTLPTGLEFSTSEGTISGTPTTAGASTGFVVTGTDGFLTADSDTFGITVTAIGGTADGVLEQGERQESVRAYTGTALHYNADFITMMEDDLNVTGKSYNELLMLWLRFKLNTTQTGLNALMSMAAADRGVSRWQEIEDVTAIGT